MSNRNNYIGAADSDRVGGFLCDHEKIYLFTQDSVFSRSFSLILRNFLATFSEIETFI